jgi:hypothetical protein
LAAPRPFMETIYIGLKDTKQAKMYWSYFLLRRCFLACVVVVLKDSQSMQIQSLMIQSSVFLLYVVKTQPYDSIAENFLQVFNELVVIAAILHMIVFSNAFTLAYEVKNQAGWTFNYLIVIQIVTNLAVYGVEIAYKVYKLVKLKMYLRQMERERLTRDQGNHLETQEVNPMAYQMSDTVAKSVLATMKDPTEIF